MSSSSSLFARLLHLRDSRFLKSGFKDLDHEMKDGIGFSSAANFIRPSFDSSSFDLSTKRNGRHYKIANMRKWEACLLISSGIYGFGVLGVRRIGGRGTTSSLLVRERRNKGEYGSVLPSCHFAISPFRQFAILPFPHFANLPFCLFAILPFCHFAFSPICHFVISLQQHFCVPRGWVSGGIRNEDQDS